MFTFSLTKEQLAEIEAEKDAKVKARKIATEKAAKRDKSAG